MPDRRLLLRGHPRLVGLDFVRVMDACDQRLLRVYFINDPLGITDPFGPADPPADAISIESTIAEDPAVQLDPDAPAVWGLDPEVGRRYLEIRVVAPGSYSPHRLRISDTRGRIDPLFSEVELSFKTGCLTGDCTEDAEAPCELAGSAPAPHLDYLARDFVSLREAMLDFVSNRHPEWTHESDADVGVTLIELIAALGDELAYIQDRYAREASLHWATQRRSLRRMARMVDFEVHDGRVPSGWLDVRVSAGTGGPQALPLRGARAFALSDTEAPIAFEVGTGMRDRVPEIVHEAWNLGALRPYWGDDSRRSRLRCGEREIWVLGPVADVALLRGRSLLLSWADEDGNRHAHRAQIDDVLPSEGASLDHEDPLLGARYHRLRLAPSDAVPVDIELTRLELSANLVPAMAGETRSAVLVCGARSDQPDWVIRTVEREGPDYTAPRDELGARGVVARQDRVHRASAGEERERPAIHRFTLPGSERAPLAWVGARLRDTLPEIELRAIDDAHVLGDTPHEIPESALSTDAWDYRPTLLDSPPDAQHWTLEDGSWRRVVGYHTESGELVHRDYATGAGTTLRFGDGRFGRAPDRGGRYRVVWRTSPGARGNVGRGAIRALEIPGDPDSRTMPSFVESVTSPFATTGGVDPEALDDVRLLAPEAWRAERRFAVRPEDYAEQAERLDWVERAHAELRWTGSWPVMRVAADPAGASALSGERRAQLEALMGAVRQAGRDVQLREPRFVVLDLEIDLCVSSNAIAEEVERRVRRALVGPRRRGEPRPFFDPDHFTFGTPLRRSVLEGAIHGVPGVRSVLGLRLAARGVQPMAPFTTMSFPPTSEADAVLRLDGDRGHPENGTLRVRCQGGA